MTEFKTEGKCVYCGGDIVEEIIKTFDPTMGPMIIGPGSKNQFRETSEGFYCQNCGLKYKFVPKKTNVATQPEE